MSFHRHYFEGFLQLYDGNYEASLNPFFQCYRIDPINPVNIFYAWALAYCNKYDEAISVINKKANVVFEDNMYKCSQLLKVTLLKSKEKISKMITQLL